MQAGASLITGSELNDVRVIGLVTSCGKCDRWKIQSRQMSEIMMLETYGLSGIAAILGIAMIGVGW